MTRDRMLTATTLALKLVLGGVFFVAGVIKLDDPRLFADEIVNYHLFEWSAPYLAATLPMTEVLVGLVLILGRRRSSWLHAAAVIAGGLMIVFLIATIHVLGRGININCGCFGGDSGPVGVATIVRDVALLVAAVLVFVLGRRSAHLAGSADPGDG